jgi:hypothetical protein
MKNNKVMEMSTRNAKWQQIITHVLKRDVETLGVLV